MRLLLESRRLSTRVEVLDWFYALGFVVYDVRKAASPERSPAKSHVYTIETSEKNGERILRDLPKKMKKDKTFKIRPDPVILAPPLSKMKPGKRPN